MVRVVVVAVAEEGMLLGVAVAAFFRRLCFSVFVVQILALVSNINVRTKFSEKKRLESASVSANVNVSESVSVNVRSISVRLPLLSFWQDLPELLP